MPKLLVLFQSRRPDVVGLAEAAVEGARRVRFAEVDLRRLAEADDSTTSASSDAMGQRNHRTLAPDDLTVYDGLIVAVGDSAEASATLSRTMGALGTSLTNKVGSVLTSAAGPERSAVLWSALTPMADRGMILVPASFDDANDPAEAARRLGTRVAEVIGWVTHARSHHHHEHAAHGQGHERHHE
jgi:hypothetical protein